MMSSVSSGITTLASLNIFDQESVWFAATNGACVKCKCRTGGRDLIQVQVVGFSDKKSQIMTVK